MVKELKNRFREQLAKMKVTASADKTNWTYPYHESEIYYPEHHP